MGIIIKKSKHFYSRLPIWLLGSFFIGFSPFVIGWVGQIIFELTKGPCLISNCIWSTFQVFVTITFPFMLFLLGILGLIILYDGIVLAKKSR